HRQHPTAPKIAQTAPKPFAAAERLTPHSACSMRFPCTSNTIMSGSLLVRGLHCLFCTASIAITTQQALKLCSRNTGGVSSALSYTYERRHVMLELLIQHLVVIFFR
ncbi:unnamed protein product, partial [Ectocarpus sp. 13 AM-2016]